MLNHEIFDAIINYYNNSPAKKKVVISFEKDNYVVEVDVAAPSIVLFRDCSSEIEDMMTSVLAATYHIIKQDNNNIAIYEHTPLILNNKFLNNNNLSRYESTTINPSNALFTIYTSIYVKS